MERSLLRRLEERKITKNGYLAELAKLLSGMTERDRESALMKINAMFEEARDDEAVMKQLGSPTRAAIGVLRNYVPSEPEALPEETAPDAGAGENGLVAPEDMPDALSAGADAAQPAAGDTPSYAPVPQENRFVEYETPEPVSEGAPEDGGLPDGYPPEAGAADKPAKPKLSAGKVVLFILFGILVALPVAVALIAVSLAFLGAGAGVITVGVFTVSLGLTGITVFADIMLLAGAGIAAAAIGLLVTFFAVWFFICCAVGFVNLIFRAGGNWCRVRETEAEE